MPATVAVLSDIHGNLPALEAVLAEPDVRAADAIVLNGDHAAGPLPVETMDVLAALGERAVWVRGNADRELVSPSPAAPAVSVWAAGRLRPDQVQLLAGLPHPVVLPVDGFGEVLFCHGTPRDDDEVVLVDSPLARYAEVLAGTTAETIVCGHTHMPFVRLADRHLIVNPGSVGMPYGHSGASWALLAGGGVALRRTAYDVEAACARIAASGFPGAAGWAEDYVRTPPSDAEALTVFTPRSV